MRRLARSFIVQVLVLILIQSCARVAFPTAVQQDACLETAPSGVAACGLSIEQINSRLDASKQQILRIPRDTTTGDVTL